MALLTKPKKRRKPKPGQTSKPTPMTPRFLERIICKYWTPEDPRHPLVAWTKGRMLEETVREACWRALGMATRKHVDTAIRSVDAPRRRIKSWGYTLRVNGRKEKERRFSSTWTETDALTELTKRLTAIEAGQLDRPADRTLGELAEEYLRYKAEKRSIRDDTRIVKRCLLPAFGAELRVRRLTGAMIAQYERRRAGEVSAYTVANELSVLRHMLRLGRRWGYLEAVPEIILPKRPRGRLRYLDEAEIARLLDACRESRNRYLWTVVVIALHTGMRKGEILGLEWERVDLSSARMTLYETKSGEPRSVPINADVYDALIRLQPDPERHGRLFPNGNDRRGSQIRTAFEAAMKRAVIVGFRFHDLRHTAASHLVMRGASLKDVQEILGHADLRMTQRYAHLSPAHLRAAVGRLEGLTAARPEGAEAPAPTLVGP